MRTITIALSLVLFTTIASAKPRRTHHKPADSAWLKGCIHERTGPDGGVSPGEARAICLAEQPEDQVEGAKAQLRLARANAKIAKARVKAAKAIEACEQAVVDACVEAAKPDGSTDCEDEALKPAFAQCH